MTDPSPHTPIRQFDDIVIVKSIFLRGPNIWTYRSVVEAIVDIGDLEDFPSNTLPGFYERLFTALPSLIEHRCSVGRRGGFLMRLREGTWPAHIIEHVALELLTLSGMKTGFGKARMTAQRGVYKVIIRSQEQEPGFLALHMARDLVMSAINDKSFDVHNKIAYLSSVVRHKCLDPSTAYLMDGASASGIPTMRLGQGNMVQLGYGAAQQRLMLTSSDNTSAIAQGIACDRALSMEMLTNAGVSTAQWRIVDEDWDASQWVEQWGFPLVIKPLDPPRGWGICLIIEDTQDIQTTLDGLKKIQSPCYIERYIPGDNFQLIMVGGKLAAATRAVNAIVRCDGKLSLSALIALQLTPTPESRSQSGQLTLRSKAVKNSIDESTILKQDLALLGFTLDCVLPRGYTLTFERFRPWGVDVTAKVHRETIAQAALALRVLGLDTAGIDVRCSDITLTFENTSGAIVNVQANPNLTAHLPPQVERAQPISSVILGHLFHGNNNGRIPIVGVLALPSQSLIGSLISQMLTSSGRFTALCGQSGLKLGDRLVKTDSALTFEDGEQILMNRRVQAAVIETSVREILINGLPYDRCSVGVVTALQSIDGLSDLYITDAEQMPNIIRTQVDVILKNGAAALNAAYEQVVDLGRYCDGEVILYADLDHPRSQEETTIAHHRLTRSGKGRAVLCRGGQITLAQGQVEIGLAHTPGTAPNGIHLLESMLLTRPDICTQVLAAVACAWHLGLSNDSMMQCLFRLAQEVSNALSA